ncbi:MAG TPA: glycosyltransferase family 2 protein [Methylobacter sp.]|jgi:glycosyltransferase involved in cell wall biosynthesis
MNQANQERKIIVSIGMPVYNGEKYIRDALDSLLNQSITEFELIISDNASTDNTETICRGYAEEDARIKYFRQSVNLGAAANFQFVLNKACGRYFMWAACDDKWSGDWIQDMLESLQDTGAEMAFGKVVHIDSNGALIDHPANYASFSFMGSALIRRVNFYLGYEALGKANVIGCLYDMAMRGELNIMLMECISGQCKFDYTLIYNSLKCGELVEAKQGYLYKRLHDESEGSQNSVKGGNIFWSLRGISRKVWPFLPGLIGDYLSHSSVIEKAILILLLPVKSCMAYLFGLRQIILRIKNVE